MCVCVYDNFVHIYKRLMEILVGCVWLIVAWVLHLRAYTLAYKVRIQIKKKVVKMRNMHYTVIK